MKLSEELLWRGFVAENTFNDPSELDTTTRSFYLGADPSAPSLTIGNLAALMMCACFARHGYKPYLMVGGATGQIGDPKETKERDLKTLEEVANNKKKIAQQLQRVVAAAAHLSSADVPVLDNLDWFKDINYLDFLRTIGKNFSMTQLLDRQFIQARIGEGGSGISYAEFSYTLIQGYDFLHLYREYGITMQLCGADQYGNCTSGLHLIKRLEGDAAEAHIWSTPLIIDPVTGRKFGKSEGNAVWLAGEPSADLGAGTDTKTGADSIRSTSQPAANAFTPVFDYYQYWLTQPDQGAEQLLKVYTLLNKSEIDDLMARHAEHPEQRLAQKALAFGSTSVVHGADHATAVAHLTEQLFDKSAAVDLSLAAEYLPTIKLGTPIVDALAITGLAPSKTAARQLLKSGAITIITDDGSKKAAIDTALNQPALIKKGKNKFVVVAA